MKKWNPYVVYLMGLTLVIPFAILSFAYIPEKKTAALVASVGFIGIGFYIIFDCICRGQWKKSLSFYGALIHSFIFSIPMLYFRYTHEGEFSGVKIFGFPGTEFHRFSEIFYLLLILICFCEAIKTKAQRA